MNKPHSSNEKRKTVIWIIVAVIGVVSFLVLKVIGFMTSLTD